MNEKECCGVKQTFSIIVVVGPTTFKDQSSSIRWLDYYFNLPFKWSYKFPIWKSFQLDLVLVFETPPSNSQQGRKMVWYLVQPVSCTRHFFWLSLPTSLSLWLPKTCPFTFRAVWNSNSANLVARRAVEKVMRYYRLAPLRNTPWRDTQRGARGSVERT